MMNITQLSLLLQSAVALCLLLFLWLILWQRSQVDSFRQQMFAVRDELFLYAANGNISFGHPAYRLLRKSMNGFIRYGHRLGFFPVLLTVIEWRVVSGATPDLSWSENWERALKTVPDEVVREHLAAFHRRAETLVLKTFVFRSALLMVGLFLTAAVMLIHNQLGGVRQAIRKAAAVIVSVFVDPRLLEADAARMAV